MDATLPQQLELTDDERELASKIEFDPQPHRVSHQTVRESCQHAYALMASLAARDAIPTIRWDYFTDPELNIGTNKSRAEVFESNGTHGEDIFRHPHFLKYLKYFIYGPDLPPKTITGFCDIINHGIQTSAMGLDELRRFARSEIRKHGLDKDRAANAFYQLCLECGQEFKARPVRDAAKQTRGR